MKINKYQPRFYRDWVSAKDLYLTRITAKETDLEILTDKPLDKNFIKGKVSFYRRQIENYIAKEARFLTALKPIGVELNAPAIVKKMTVAAKLANVGPMAGVAGAVAEFLGKDLLKKGYREVIIENGGDIFMKTQRIRKIRIYAGSSKLKKVLGLKIKAQDTPLGICTSSGTIGHSLSFGRADSVVVLSRSATLADAAATAVANRIRKKEDLEKAIHFAKSIRGISGAIVMFRKDIICWGKIELSCL